MKPTLLAVDDEADIRFGVKRHFSRRGITVHEAASFADAQRALATAQYDAVLLDLKLPDGNGLDLIAEARKAAPDTGIVVITGHGDIPLAVEAMRRGADNFLTKPVKMADLEVFLQRTLELQGLRRDRSTQKRLTKKEEAYFGKSPAVRKALELAGAAAANDSAILVQGETGTGKGVLAKWIHERSGRRAGPFVEVNCSSLRGDLLASELFGHVRGAFTSAVQDREGLIEVANGGTLFLDEIGDMDLAVQAQLLKVIEEKCYRRVGESRPRTSDFRLLCATNKDLAKETQEGRFRQDLYFRINVLPIPLSPLRDMVEDLPGLVQHVLGSLGSPEGKPGPEVMGLLRTYAWPGNIRELRNVLERARLLSGGKTLSLEHFPGLARPSASLATKAKVWNLDELTAAHIKEAVEHFGGSRKLAAEALGISEGTLYRWLDKAESHEVRP